MVLVAVSLVSQHGLSYASPGPAQQRPTTDNFEAPTRYTQAGHKLRLRLACTGSFPKGPRNNMPRGWPQTTIENHLITIPQVAYTKNNLNKHVSPLGQIPLYGVSPHTAAYMLWE